MRYFRPSAVGLVVAAAIAAAPAIAHAQYNTNLILNPGAEAGTGSVTGNDVEVVPSWTTTSNFTVAQYGDASSFPATYAGPTDRGANYFAGGPDNPSSTASQTQSLAFATSAISGGTADYTMSGWFGGWEGQYDNATLFVSFVDAGNTVLGSTSIGAVPPEERSGYTGLVFRSTTGVIPVGATEAQFLLQMNRVGDGGEYNDGYADNLSFSVDAASTPTTTPEPSSLALLGTGLLGLAPLSRRKRRK